MPAIKFADRSIQFFVAIQYLNIVSAKISVIPADPQSDASRDLRLANERLVALEKECKVAQSQLETASDLLSKAAGGFPVWAVAAAFIAGAALVWVFR